jgi:uncharacterized membrane protein (Fun14 family)
LAGRLDRAFANPASVAVTLPLGVDPTNLALQGDASAIIGTVIGFAAKKVAGIPAVIVGAELLLFTFLESRGYIQVNWGEMGGFFENLASDAPGQAQSFVDTFLSTAGIGVGFALGIRKR